VLNTWTVNVTFDNDPVSGVASGVYSLDTVPDGTAGLSAKTNWSLRQRTALAFDPDGQAAADFTLMGGDLNGSNSITTLDYSALSQDGLPPTASPTSTGRRGSVVRLLDYEIELVQDW